MVNLGVRIRDSFNIVTCKSRLASPNNDNNTISK